MRAARAALAAAACLVAGGCRSQWFHETSRSEVVRTDVVVRTQPPGAVVWIDDRRMDAAPVRIPVEYEHVTEQWSRQSNQGAAIRESTGVVGTILLFPIWLPASLIHGREEMKRHVYGANVHVLRASHEDHGRAEKTIELAGEEEVVVDLVLSPR